MEITLRCPAHLPDTVESEAWQHIDILRQIRNHAVKDYYNADYNNKPSDYDQHKKLTQWKQQWSLFSEPSRHAAQQAITQIHNDLETLNGRRKNGYNVGELNWQGTGEFRSISYNQPSRWNVDNNTGDNRFVQLRLEKIGWFKIRATQPIPDANQINRIILKKEKTGDWFVSLITDTPTVEKPPVSELSPPECVGIDLGITSYIHTSNNRSVNTLDLSHEYERYAREQRKLDRKQHGSNNWDKQRQRVAKARLKIKRKVVDFQHKLTTWLVQEYDFIAVEDLNVKPMLETTQNAKNKQDAAWSRFITMLEYKADLHGTHVVKVNPAGTTKECSRCGVETDKPIWVREHSCPACGHTEDRDLNAAKNILNRGLRQIGAGCSESTPMQTALPVSPPQREVVDAKRVVEVGSPEA